MALPASDVFTGADGTALATHNAGWTIAKNNFQINSNQARGTASDDCYAWWNADVFAADQYSKGSINGLASGTQYRGVTVRNSGTGASHNCYVFYTDGSDSAIAKVTAGGASSILKSIATTFSSGDVVELRASGTSTTTLSLYKNSVFVDSVANSSSPFTSGAAGITTYGTFVGIDDWSAGNLGAAGSIVPILLAHARRRRG